MQRCGMSSSFRRWRMRCVGTGLWRRWHRSPFHARGAVLQVRHRNLAIYNRLITLLRDHSRRLFLFSNEHHKETYTAHRPGESPNDRSDRAIRIAAAWYKTHLRDVEVRCKVHVQRVCCAYARNVSSAPLAQVLLVTNDVANLKLAKSEGLLAMTMKQFVASISTDFPDLSDRLAASADDDDVGMDAAVAISTGGPTHLYPAHLPLSKIQEGLKSGRLKSGTIRLNRDCWFEGTVGVETTDGEYMSVTISGKEHVNRATEVRCCPLRTATQGVACVWQRCR